jgi:hypothetical protein
MSMSRSMQRRSRAARLRARGFWASRPIVPDEGTYCRSTSGSPRPRRRRLPKPATTPGRTTPRDSPLGRVQRGEDRGGWGCGDKGRRLSPVEG